MKVVRKQRSGLLIFTTANGTSDGYNRFLRSANQTGIEVIPLPAAAGAAGQEVKRLRAALERRAVDPRRLSLVLGAVASDVIVAGSAAEIVAAFRKQKGRVVFSGNVHCRPDASLADQYPKSESYRFLDVAAFIGHGPDLVSMLSDDDLETSDGGQLAFTRLFLDKAKRQKYGLGIDRKADIMQGLTGSYEDVVVRYRGRQPFLQNTRFSSVPLVVHGDAQSRQHLNTLGNYLAGGWEPRDGCVACWGGQLELGSEPETFPRVLLALFIDQPTPFLEEFFGAIRELIYPKAKIDLFLYSGAKYHHGAVEQLAEKVHGAYGSVTVVGREQGVSSRAARSQAMDVVTPMLAQIYTTRGNFMTELGVDMSAAPPAEYKAIVTSKRKGLWNVPFVSECYLVKRSVFSDDATRPDFEDGSENVHNTFSKTIVDSGKFLLVSNRANFGHLVDPRGFNTSRLHNEMWQVTTNRWDWEHRYLHQNYSRNLDPSVPVAEPCADVFWAPILTERFCQELIETMENHGQWSGGTNTDPRLAGGYENVPTRDIHMSQIDYDREWHMVLRYYVQPIQQRVFAGYDEDPPVADLNFVVRYKPEEQPALVPHHDASTYTINIALNTPGKDYEGGGCRFLRQDCSVTDSRRGWLLMHPGRLTHQHEGLPTTSGTRYIMVSFVDP
ncbi:multifunctional procollagen lysine hydroxylase and glycosyltransferase LH3-like [Pollicipes pollicipes]|uniref:multifunctional procollagen lysine hydroxylase and glycosyltransferase LH3-like n=1 Tax=Pollicipes pollicipes TaxID=41117 RepID=UPI0018856020|nr:multifunctional procollagen lysine hydroxylase and glycosyltransferase LH3-like [Pollicipes pollicipes]